MQSPTSNTSIEFPKVSIVGRPNVGKSTLFNRLVGRRKSIVMKEAGTTRDRVKVIVNWEGYFFEMIDTGGLKPGGKIAFESFIEREVEKAIEEANFIIMMTDGREGLTPLDEEIAEKLRRIKKPVLLAVNKCDNVEKVSELGEFYKLGLGEPNAISSMEGLGIGDMMSQVIRRIPKVKESPANPNFSLCIVGEPNVGKSTLLNAFLKKERAIVTAVAGTTRDSLEEILPFKQHFIRLIDTAGICHKRKVKEVTTLFSLSRAESSIKESNVAILVFDASLGIRRDTKKIAALLDSHRKPTLLVANKWDLVKGVEQSSYENNLKQELGFLRYAPMVFISAKNKRNLDDLIEQGIDLWQRSSHHILTRDLNEFLMRMKSMRLPTTAIRLKFLTQTDAIPQEFVCFVKNKKLIPKHYFNHFENELKRRFHLEGIPLRVMFREEDEESD